MKRFLTAALTAILLVGLLPFQVLALTSQTITFDPLADMTYGDAPFTVSATADSSLAVEFGSLTGDVCTVAGDVVTINGVGQCIIHATQPGDATYAAADPVDQPFTVGKATLTVTASSPADGSYGDSAPAITPLYGTFVGIDTASILDTAPTCTTAYVEGNAPNTYATSCSGGASTLYTFTYVPGTFTVAKAAQTISFGALGARTFGDAPFTVSATGGGSGNPVTFSSTTVSVCTVSGVTVTIAGGGTCTIKADQAGDANYTAAPSVSQSFTVGKDSQATLAVTGPASATFGDADAAIITSGGSGGGTVTFSTGASTACSIVSGKLHVVSGTGTCAITATKAADADYTVATSASFTVTVGKDSQAITFTSTAPASAVVGGATYTVTTIGGGGSGNAVILSIDATSSTVCSISGATVTFTGAGTCKVNANQAGNGDYSAASLVQQSFAVGRGAQAILSVTGPTSATFGAADATFTTSGGSGTGAVSFSTGASTACSIVSGKLHVVSGTGTCVVTATKAADTNYMATTSAPFTVTVGKAAQAISFGALGGKTFGNAPFTVTATATSGLPVTFTSLTPGQCTVSVATVTIIAAGTCTINATQAGSANYNAATPVPQSFAIAKVAPVCPSPGAKAVVMNVALSGAAGCTDVENDVLSYAIVTKALHGTAAISTAGTWTYTPAANYVGTDLFSFNASDGTKVSAAMTVSLTITNHPVDALNDSAVVTATTSTVIDVIHSASAAGTAGKDNPGTGDTGQPLKITAVTQGAHGGVTTSGSTVTYDPAGCVTGTDLFTYTISDGLTTDTASVIVTIARPGTNGLSVNPITDTPGTGLVSDGTTSTTGGTVPLKVSWCGATASPSTVRGYTVQESGTGGSTWPTTAILTATTATSTTRNLSVGTTYQWRTKTIDSSSRTGAYRTSLTAKVGLYQETSTAITYAVVGTGVWNPSTSTSAAGGAERATSNKGASASITLTNVRQVAIVGPRSATRGSFEVWVDGAKVATVSEKATTTVYRHLLYVRGLTSGAGVTHIVKIVAVGDGRIDLDAILSLS